MHRKRRHSGEEWRLNRKGRRRSLRAFLDLYDLIGHEAVGTAEHLGWAPRDGMRRAERKRWLAELDLQAAVGAVIRL